MGLDVAVKRSRAAITLETCRSGRYALLRADFALGNGSRSRRRLRLELKHQPPPAEVRAIAGMCEQGSCPQAAEQENTFAFAVVRTPATGKDFKPSRRLSETTDPQSVSALRVAFLSAEITKRQVRSKPVTARPGEAAADRRNRVILSVPNWNDNHGAGDADTVRRDIRN